MHEGRVFFVDDDCRAVKVRNARLGEERDVFRSAFGRVSGFELAASSGLIAVAEDAVLHVIDAEDERSPRLRTCGCSRGVQRDGGSRT